MTKERIRRVVIIPFFSLLCLKKKKFETMNINLNLRSKLEVTNVIPWSLEILEITFLKHASLLVGFFGAGRLVGCFPDGKPSETCEISPCFHKDGLSYLCHCFSWLCHRLNWLSWLCRYIKLCTLSCHNPWEIPKDVQIRSNAGFAPRGLNMNKELEQGEWLF